MTIINNAEIFTSSTRDSKPFIGYVVFDEGKITEIGSGKYPRSAKTPDEIVDAEGAVLLPGLIDAHTHLGTIGDSLGFESDDINDINDPVAPQLSALDSVNPFDRCFRDAYDAGITTVYTGPGSASPISGNFIAIKTFGRRVDDMILKSPCAMKFALGENPKQSYHEKEQTPETRMATAALIREALKKARRYKKDLDAAAADNELDPPDFDAKCEALLPVLSREIPVHIHAHRADDICTGIRIAKEFGLDYSIIHCTEGHLISEILKSESTKVMCGPLLCDRSKPELYSLTPSSAGILDKAGVNVSIITDHPVIPVQYLMLCVSLAVKNGMDRFSAYKAVTINPARLCGIDSRVGSIEIGKDADLVLFNGDPLDIFTKVIAVYIDGRKVK